MWTPEQYKNMQAYVGGEALEQAGICGPQSWWVERRGSQYQVQTAHRGPGSSFCIAPINHWADDAKGTAQLIAAAPDLYDALQAVMLEFGPGTMSDAAYRSAVEALEKARGEDSK